ncbi:MAG TPA: patatin-like phospholipase family protein [Gemmatimonadaceae bacterium]|nr:patatin-like phospholipase family protein [Gemmatimonadaceae bacterium]
MTTIPASFNEVLLAELKVLRPGVFDATIGVPLENLDAPHDVWLKNHAERDAQLRTIYHEIGALDGERPLAALCLSGGGIRSATFNLGVIQALAKRRVLRHIDYLSSVSGGGYIAGWLKAWQRRTSSAIVGDGLRGAAVTPPSNPLAPEPRPIDDLRNFSNYLTPRLGLFSLDWWALITIVARNLLLNWLVIVPLIATAAAVPQLALRIIHWTGLPELSTPLLVLSFLLAFVASFNIHRYRRTRYTSTDRPERGREQQIILGCVAPFVLSTILLATAGRSLPWTTPDWVAGLPLVGGLVWRYPGPAFACLWAVVIPVTGWALSAFWWRARDGLHWYTELLALVLSGLVGAAILLWLASVIQPALTEYPRWYVALSMPALIGDYLIARTLFIAFSNIDDLWPWVSREPADPMLIPIRDRDREWWSRLAGCDLFVALGWLMMSTVSLFAGHFFGSVVFPRILSGALGLSAISGLVTQYLGLSVSTSSGRGGESAQSARIKERILGVAATVFCITLVLLLGELTRWIANTLFGLPIPSPHTLAAILALLWVMLGLLLVAAVMGRLVYVNDFSLHAMYRNRLVRAYLGASNTGRAPNPFTGFAADDDMPLSALAVGDAARPLHVLGVALNLVTGNDKLAWQQRKAESFSMTPLYCGNFHEGYRPTHEYGGGDGVSLGTAMAISGAAANPNMGYHSSPVVTFLLTLFNARLGMWLGNTNQRGAETYRRHGPHWSVVPLVAELLGLTDAQNKYVCLSDGGHFDNLGLYEMVLRRCRHIIVCDAGEDLHSTFADLGDAIRKIRIDFAVPIEFRKKIAIAPRDDTKHGVYGALASIGYSEADGQTADGTLIYLKPALFGRGVQLPYDVFAYSRVATAFPHQSTVNQWFDETQFESYRALGEHVMTQITDKLATGGETTVPQLFEAFERYLDAHPAATTT